LFPGFQIVVPILKTLYHAAERNNHHIYMSLIILVTSVIIPFTPEAGS
jgi:hypothetical protein